MAVPKDCVERIGEALLAGRMSGEQAAGFALILDRRGHVGEPHVLAYVLATAFHETAGLMQPVREKGGADYLRRRYDVTGDDPARARRNGNDRPGDGLRYAGRGFVQITWKANYARVGGFLGIDLVGQPDRALEPSIAVTILIRGMTEGWFTGRKTSDYIGPGKADFLHARRVVNGLDRAALIASHAERILAVLQPQPIRRRVSAVAAPGRPPEPPPPPPQARP